MITCAIVGGLLASYPALSTDQAASYKSAGKGGYHHAQQKLKVVEDLYAGFFNRHDIGVAQRLIVENYKQHNPFVGDGIKPFLDFFSQTFGQPAVQRQNIPQRGQRRSGLRSRQIPK